MPKMFKLMDLRTDEDVLGGAVSESNPYVSTYASVVEGEKPVAELEVGEGSLAKFHLSGTTGVYKIVRVE